MDNALTGRRVLIVGASAGIGAALGQAASEAGASSVSTPMTPGRTIV